MISAKQFPKTFAWVDRFSKVVGEAKAKAPKVTTLKGPQAAKSITEANFNVVKVDEGDPLGLRAGQEVEVWPTDSGSSHKDRGTLVGLTANEVVIATKAQGGKEVRIHCPRTNFRIRAIAGATEARL